MLDPLSDIGMSEEKHLMTTAKELTASNVVIFLVSRKKEHMPLVLKPWFCE